MAPDGKWFANASFIPSIMWHHEHRCNVSIFASGTTDPLGVAEHACMKVLQRLCDGDTNFHIIAQNRLATRQSGTIARLAHDITGKVVK